MKELITLLTVSDLQRLGLLGLLWILNTLAAVATALFNGSFDIHKLPEFVVTYLKWIVGFALISAFYNAGLTLAAMVTALNATVGAALASGLNILQVEGIFVAIAAALFWACAKNIGALVGFAGDAIGSATAQAGLKKK